MPTAAGIYFAYHEGGTKIIPPVVLLHDAGGTSQWWSAELRRLPGLRVIAPDLPGHGKSEGAGQQSISAYAAQMIELLNQMGVARAIFAGHAMGGCIALELALERPDLTAGLALISTGANIPLPPDLLENSRSPLTFSRVLPALRELYFGQQIAPEKADELIKEISEQRQSVFHGDLLAMQNFDVVQRLGEIRAPALVVCGADDHLTPQSYAHTLVEHIPDAALAVIPEAGHMLPLEKPTALRQALLAFLSSKQF